MIAPSKRSTEEIGTAISSAIREAVVRHAAAGYPIASVEGDQVVWLRPSQALGLMQSQGQQLPEPLTATAPTDKVDDRTN